MALSCLTGLAFRVYNIRAGRKDPGLKPQHLLSVRTAASITGAEVKGDSLGSKEIYFCPGPVRPGVYSFDVGELKSSAGSTGLVFQTVLPPLCFGDTPSSLKIRGGTHVEWSPPADYIKEVFLPAIRLMGAEVRFSNPVLGYYPIGRGEIEAEVRPAKRPLRPLNIKARGRLLEVTVTSAASNLPESIAQRQLADALSRLKGLSVAPEGRVILPPSPGRGTYLFILARLENINAGFSVLGARGKRAEQVGEEAAERLLHYIERDGAVDKHLSDQMALFMALAQGPSSITVEEVTNHLKTNIHVIEMFLPVRFCLSGGLGETGSLDVTGCGRG